MAASLAEEAIALLIDLAERGEIDPWDVQVIDVIDRFLAKLSPSATTRDLSESGQAFLYASMLVYLKALALAEAELEEDDEFEEAPFEGEIDPLPSIPLEQTLRPRPVARIQRTRPVTLKEIIAQFQVLEQAVQERAARPKKVRNKAAKGERITSITQLSHPENLAETVSLIEPILADAWQTSSLLTFEALVALQQELYPGKASLATVFWALLMMASRSQVRLHQEEFYQDLSVSEVFQAEVEEPELQSA